MKTAGLILSFFLVINAVVAQDMTAYQKQLFVRGNDTLRYRILYPENYDAGKPIPLIIFLHGSGERGNDNEAQLLHGGDLFLKDSIRKNYPALVIFPQCPQMNSWSKFPTGKRDTSAYAYKLLNRDSCTRPEYLVKLLADSLVNSGLADKKRIYLGGLSLGGFGTYDLVIHYPAFFAAAFPICGQANVPLYVEKASEVPVWIFHGGKDDVVDPRPDRELIKALRAAGAKNAKYTEYPEAGHNSWDNTFAEPGLLPWLFSNHKP